MKLPKNLKDLSGMDFVKWHVDKLSSLRGTNGGAYWVCKCVCGQRVVVSSTSLISGKSTQCKFCKSGESRKKFCINNHDTEIWGRTSSYACRGCVRDKHLKTHYGITLEDFENLYKEQKGLCAICKKPLGEYRVGKPGWGNGCRIEVDHKHILKSLMKKRGISQKDTVRGLLCGGRWAGCNRKLGRIDNIEWLENVISYLKNPPAQQGVLNKNEVQA
jgi:hypothetical protein